MILRAAGRKRLLAGVLGAALFAMAPSYAAAKLDGCALSGHALQGKVKIVESFVSFPDLRVQAVSSFPDKCGKWQFVESLPDFTVTFVDSFPDFTIVYVESFPGLP